MFRLLFFIRFFSLSIILIGFSQVVWGQVRLIQWTDVHSKLQTMGRQVLAIDQMAQEFKAKHPKGEVVIYIIGDFTSPNVYVNDQGWFSIEVMKLFRDRGYTVLFTPGNHDAFDWVNKPGDIRLFVDQMEEIKRWGVKILAENFVGRTLVMDSLLTPSYRLQTVDPVTHIVGLTLDRLMKHSNLYEEEARSLFEGIENYQQTLNRVLPGMRRDGVEAVILGVHENNRRVANIVKERDFEKAFGIRIPLAMAAHDHLIATYRERGTMISDAGSYGSFSVIDILKDGKVSEAILHIAISSEALLAVINKDVFYFGEVRKNWVTTTDIENSWVNEYYQRIESHLSSARERLGRVLVTLENDINETKFDLQHGKSRLGSMVAESMVWWGRRVIPGKKRLIIAMYNSSSYRMEDPIPRGPVTELTIRQIYPYSDMEAAIGKVTGEEAERLYFSMREDYIAKSGNKDRYSPQINSDFREYNGRLQVNTQRGWRNIGKNKKYHIILDPWLAAHYFGQGYKVKEWLEILEGREPLAAKSMTEILVKFLPLVLRRNDRKISRSIRNKRNESHKNRFSSNYYSINKADENRRGGLLRCQTLFSK